MTRAHLARLRSTAVLVLMFLLLTALADFFFYGHPAGWTLGAYVAALTAALVARGGRSMRRGAGAVMLLGLTGLALMAVEEPGTLVVTLLGLGVVSLAMVNRGGWTSSVSAWLRRWTIFAMTGWTRLFGDMRRQNRRARRTRGRPSVTLAVVGGWTIPAVLGLVFVVLFSAANPVFEMVMKTIHTFVTDAIERVPDLLAPQRMFFWFFVGLWVWALLRMKTRRAVVRPEVMPDTEIELDRLISPALVVRCLLVFNAIFALQTSLDVRYLLLGGGLPPGMTFTGYAHRGAYPLVAASLLAACFVVLSFRRNGPAQRSPVARKLVYLWLVQNGLLVISAAWRLAIYVEAFGLTRWRVAALLWMLLVAVGLALIIYKIVRCRSNAWLLRANALSAVLMFYACAPIDFDGFIATFDVRHCREVGASDAPIDLDYIRSLGPEAIPALDWAAGRFTTDKAEKARRYRDELRAGLAGEVGNWRGWTWRRQRLLDAVPAPARALGR